MSQPRAALSVSEITAQIKGIIESQYSSVWVHGEISNFKHHSSGHMYFTIKDQSAELRCIMFRGFNQTIHFKPEDGMAVLLQGKVTVYEPRGQYQLMVQLMEPEGIGTLFLAFEALKKQLQLEGLFDDSLKKPLPDLPIKIGMVTSQNGAAFKDMAQILKRRAPYAEIILRPSLVQGDAAAEDIINGIEDLSSNQGVDVIIIGRGGGSLEDLWPFNEEALARAISNCKLPIISAVGHETDVTISDMVADLRAPTPSAAAEIVAPSNTELQQRIQQGQESINKLLQFKLNQLWQMVDHLSDRHVFQNPQTILERQKEKLTELKHMISSSINHLLSISKIKLTGFEKELSALNPSSILNRGYSILLNKDGLIIRDGSELKDGELFEAKIGEGRIEAEKTRDLPKDN